MHGLNLYDYSARYYEPALGRFTSVDSLVEKFYSWSPYVYCFNDPVKHTDPDGEAPIIGALIGGALDYASGKTGTEAWTNVDMGSIAISAAAGATGVGLASVVSKGVTAAKVVQNGSKAIKIAAAVTADAAVGATVSTGTQLAKDGIVDMKAVAIDAVATAVVGNAAANKAKEVVKQTNQAKVLTRQADHAKRVAGGSAPRQSRIDKATASSEKLNNYVDKRATVVGQAATGVSSNVTKEVIKDEKLPKK